MTKTSFRTAGRRNVAVLAALAISALAATPLVSRALATSDEPAAITAGLRVEPVEVAPVSAAPKAEPCLRKVRVVYGGYGTQDGCAR
ncbi:hypothetical protein Q8W71_29675 [Methylobacterium sp. NEAU 140]|uniref:hypothetical protein n=1 Tax=Methylobacterium sp. NEAU 140 TaxID=3064945 RepID=UPI002733D493|nr:hypothetical protein [Methylobacterium sp. NEAU 140]MDP4026780.1 hypothetical protein [Methylobacterium sp. NEAU 140]